MINLLEDIKSYLPKYLSEESTRELLREIGGFPDNISNSLYTNALKDQNVIFQGDGLKDMLVINLPQEKIDKVPSLVISNTCDISEGNSRVFPSNICYIPIFRLEKYIDSLRKRDIYDTDEKLINHIESIKKQYITQILFLPIGSGLQYEAIVFLDRINNCSNSAYPRLNLQNSRLFTLSTYGHYLLLTKLSIHFSRLQERVDRNSGKIL